MIGLIGQLVEARHRLRDVRRRLPVGGSTCPATACSRTSPSSRCVPGLGSRWTRRSARRSTSCSGRRRSPASRPGTRPGGAGRPGWHTECVVMSLDLLGDGVRPARRWDRPDLPPPRERARPGGGVGPRLRPPLGPQRVGDRRRREDVEVAGQLHLARRPARPQRRTRLPAARAALPLPLAHRDHPEGGPRRRSRTRPARRDGTSIRRGRPARRQVRSSAIRPQASSSTRMRWQRFRAAHGRRSRHPWRRSRQCSIWYAMRTPPPTPATTTRARRSAHTGAVLAGALGLAAARLRGRS